MCISWTSRGGPQTPAAPTCEIALTVRENKSKSFFFFSLIFFWQIEDEDMKVIIPTTYLRGKMIFLTCRSQYEVSAHRFRGKDISDDPFQLPKENFEVHTTCWLRLLNSHLFDFSNYRDILTLKCLCTIEKRNQNRVFSRID